MSEPRTEADLALIDADDVLAAHPGEPHEFRTVCRRCGEYGMLHISVITDHERVDITDVRLQRPLDAGREGATG